MTKATQKPVPKPMAVMKDWPAEIKMDLVKQPFYYPEEQFTTAAKSLNKDQQEARLREMRIDRDFYKRILDEKYREKNPNSYRYVDANIRIEILNLNGRILKQLIDE